MTGGEEESLLSFLAVDPKTGDETVGWFYASASGPGPFIFMVWRNGIVSQTKKVQSTGSLSSPLRLIPKPKGVFFCSV